MISADSGQTGAIPPASLPIVPRALRRAARRVRGGVVHELAATRNLLQIALDAAAAAGATRVLGIDVVIGELTSMIDDSVQFYFDALSRDTIAAGARLNFRREPALASCSACGHQAPVRPPLTPTCAACGAHALTVSGGQAFYVASIEVDHESPGSHPDSES